MPARAATRQQKNGAIGAADDQQEHNAGKKELCTTCVPASTSGWELVKSVVGSDNGKTVTMTMEDLGLKIPFMSFAGASNIEDLVDILRSNIK